MKPKTPNRRRQVEAWILDAQVHKKGIILWLKTADGGTVRALHPYYPSFYISFQQSVRNSGKNMKNNQHDKDRYRQYEQRLSELENVKKVSLVKRRVKAEDPHHSDVLRVQAASPFRLKKIIRQIKDMEVFVTFNADIPIVQMFFYETGLFPFALCRVLLEENSVYAKILKIKLVDSNEEIEYQLPPLKIIWLDIDIDSDNMVLFKSDKLLQCTITPDPVGQKIDFGHQFPPFMISKHGDSEVKLIIKGKTEYHTLMLLQKAIWIIDPDIIFTAQGDDKIFPYLLSRASYLGIDGKFTVSRDRSPLRQTRFQVNGNTSFMSYGVIYRRAQEQFYLNGRLHIDSAICGSLRFDDGNLFGIVEVARVTYTPLQRLTRITIGGALQSLQFFHAYRQKILIPEDKKNAEYFREAANLLLSDRGGHILNPKVGMFRRVAELDFTSMYPALMVKYNVSPEKLNCSCCKREDNPVPGLPYHLCTRQPGVVPLSLRVPLMKRIQYKTLSKGPDKREAQRYKKIEEALKWILVVCFGYLGFRNARFGRIEAHQAVCAYSREFLLNAMEIVEGHGLEVIHGIVDSLYVRPPDDMGDKDFHRNCQECITEIIAKTQIPIGYDPKYDYFRIISFLPTKDDPEIGALNRYWGIKQSGGVKVRGVEIRRHDAPPLIKDFQLKAMDAIGEAEGSAGFDQILAENLVPLLLQYFRKLETGDVSPQEIAITIRMTRRPDQYKVQNYQAIAGQQLERLGMPVGPGQKISFIIVNDRAENSQDRVMPLSVYERRGKHFDIRKYKELLVRALANILPYELPAKIKKKLQEMSSSRDFRSDLQQKTLMGFVTEKRQETRGFLPS